MKSNKQRVALSLWAFVLPLVLACDTIGDFIAPNYDAPPLNELHLSHEGQ